MSTYVFSESSLVERQMRGIADTFDSLTADRLKRIGIAPGWRCLEIGAGNGSVAEMLADLTGPDGHVVATDIDTAYLDHLRSAGRRNLEVRRHDITSGALPDGMYDLIHARLLLMHLPQRREILTRLWRALKPGGWCWPKTTRSASCRWSRFPWIPRVSTPRSQTLWPW
jgi:ubiquinone/menaquinone biosynthesis C-methylase UbiE